MQAKEDFSPLQSKIRLSFLINSNMLELNPHKILMIKIIRNHSLYIIENKRSVLF